MPVRLFDRARKALESFTPGLGSGAQEYNVVCRNGHRVRGDRTEGYQAMRCISCGDLLFILPKSPLPVPPAPASKAKSTKQLANEHNVEPVLFEDPLASAQGYQPAHSPTEVDGEIDWVDEVKPEPTDHPKPKRNVAQPTKGIATPPNRPTSPAVAEELVPVEPIETWGEWVRRNRNPLIFAGVLTLVLTTAWVQYRNSLLADLPRLIEIGKVEGIAALEEGQFDKAKALLGDAARALTTLGDQSEAGLRLIQASKEAAIYTDLTLEPLEQLIETARSSEPADWSRTFKTLYRNRSILVDSKLETVPEPGSKEPPTLDYTIVYGAGGNVAAKGKIDLTGFDLLTGTARKKGDFVRFGARLESISLDSVSGNWLVRLVPDSGVYLNHPKALEFIGFTVDSPDDSGDTK